MRAAALTSGKDIGVGTLPPAARVPTAGRPDMIAIVIPGERATVSAIYRTADGRERCAFVRAPMVSVSCCSKATPIRSVPMQSRTGMGIGIPPH